MKIERKYMAHYLNATFAADDGTASYVRLGKDLEEYSPELSANVEKKTNILGNETVSIDSYQKQGEVSPYYAEKGDPLFEKLQSIIDNDLVLDDLGRPEQRRVPCGAGRVLHRGQQLRRRHHWLSDSVQRALYWR